MHSAVSTVINILIFLITAVLVAGIFFKEGKWQPGSGAKAFRYFTVLSNVLCAVSALVMAIGQANGSVSPGVVMFKYLGTVSVTVTLLTVLLFLGPTIGYKVLFSGRDLYLHLIGPLMAIASFCFLEKRGLSLGTALLGLLPVILYGSVYLYKVVFSPEDKRWEDFYGFNKGGKWPVSFAAMMIGALIVCLALWAAPSASSSEGGDTMASLAGTYRYEGEGFGGDFTITLSADGTYGFYEGPLSSYMGAGTWYAVDDVIHMSEGDAGFALSFAFAVEDGALAYLSAESDAFPYVALSDGARFICGVSG